MLCSNSLKKCHATISAFINMRGYGHLDIIAEKELKLAFNTPRGECFVSPLKYMKTHNDFNTYLSILCKAVNTLISDEDISIYNNVISEIKNDRFMLKSLNNLGLDFRCHVKPTRYVKYIVTNYLMRATSKNGSTEYWKGILDFSENEIFSFDRDYLKFQEKLMWIMYGYTSGELRFAYSNGENVLKNMNRY